MNVRLCIVTRSMCCDKYRKMQMKPPRIRAVRIFLIENEFFMDVLQFLARSARTHSQQMNHAAYFRSVFTVVIWRIVRLDISSVKLQRGRILREKERAKVMKDKHNVAVLFECNKSSGSGPGERRLRTALPYYISYLLSRASHSERLK